MCYISYDTLYSLITSLNWQEYTNSISAIDSADAIEELSGMLEINEVGDSAYIEWGDPDRFLEGWL
jgi:hypothetical protein